MRTGAADGLIPDIYSAGDCMDARLGSLPYLIHALVAARYSAHLPGLTSPPSADVVHGEKTGTHRSRTSPLPGSPLGTGAAFSITAATTLPASMLPPDGKSPLCRNVSRREGREGGGGGEGGRERRRDESNALEAAASDTQGCGPQRRAIVRHDIISESRREFTQ